ncbi:hypothetical protein L0P85_04535 [Terrisporobacter glycolicus]|nr:hypothetical protein L0P85_04535 [Terrisporobacter glycolicus]
MDFDEIKDIYDILFESLYKTDKIKEILNIYNKKISSIVDTKYIESSLEKTILKLKE